MSECRTGECVMLDQTERHSEKIAVGESLGAICKLHIKLLRHSDKPQTHLSKPKWDKNVFHTSIYLAWKQILSSKPCTAVHTAGLKSCFWIWLIAAEVSLNHTWLMCWQENVYLIVRFSHSFIRTLFSRLLCDLSDAATLLHPLAVTDGGTKTWADGTCSSRTAWKTPGLVQISGLECCVK